MLPTLWSDAAPAEFLLDHHSRRNALGTPILKGKVDVASFVVIFDTMT